MPAFAFHCRLVMTHVAFLFSARSAIAASCQPRLFLPIKRRNSTPKARIAKVNAEAATAGAGERKSYVFGDDLKHSFYTYLTKKCGGNGSLAASAATIATTAEQTKPKKPSSAISLGVCIAGWYTFSYVCNVQTRSVLSRSSLTASTVTAAQLLVTMLFLGRTCRA